jgi:hypothetical protein
MARSVQGGEDRRIAERDRFGQLDFQILGGQPASASMPLPTRRNPAHLARGNIDGQRNGRHASFRHSCICGRLRPAPMHRFPASGRTIRHRQELAAWHKPSSGEASATAASAPQQVVQLAVFGGLRSWWYSSRLVAKLKAAHSRLAGKRS